MKKYLILATTALTVLAACNNNEFEEGPSALAKSETPIIVKTGVTTKAAVATGSDVTATFALISKATAPEAADWNTFVPRTTNNLSGGAFSDYATDAANVAVGAFQANPTVPQVISFNPNLYYNKTQSSTPIYDEQAYLVGVAPAGTVSSVGGIVTFSTKDGEQDVMYAAQINRKDPGATEEDNTETFQFEHQTGQVSFSVKLKEAMDNQITVKSLSLKKVQLPASIKLADGAVTYDTPADLALPGLVSNVLVTEEGIAAGNPVMIAPIADLLIDVTITIDGEDKPYINVPVTFETTSGTGVTKGNASLVTIAVNKPLDDSGETKIEATATVVAWGTGNKGSIDLN